VHLVGFIIRIFQSSLHSIRISVLYNVVERVGVGHLFVVQVCEASGYFSIELFSVRLKHISAFNGAHSKWFNLFNSVFPCVVRNTPSE
jgi:hypothetical protein